MTGSLAFRAYLAVMILAAVAVPGYLGAVTAVGGQLSAVHTAAEAASPFAPALVAAVVGLGLSVAAGPGTLRLSRFHLGVLLDSPRPRFRWLAPRVWVPVGAAVVVTATLASIPLVAGAGAWWMPWLLALPMLAGLFAATAGLGHLAGNRALLIAQMAAWGAAAVLSAGALWLTPGTGAFAFLFSGLGANLGTAPVMIATSAALVVVAAGAALFPRLLRHLDERTLLERAGRRQAAVASAVTGDSAAPGRVFAGDPVRTGRLGTTPRHLAGPRLRVRAHLLGALRRPLTLVPAAVAALAAIVCLVLTAHVGEGALWAPVLGFIVTASLAIRPFDHALAHGMTAGANGLSGLHPAAEAALALALPVALLIVLVAIASTVAPTAGLHALLLTPSLVALHARPLFAPPMPTGRLTSVPTAAGDLQGVRAVLWLVDAPLRVALLGVVAGLAWHSASLLALVALVALVYAVVGTISRVGDAA